MPFEFYYLSPSPSSHYQFDRPSDLADRDSNHDLDPLTTDELPTETTTWIPAGSLVSLSLSLSLSLSFLHCAPLRDPAGNPCTPVWVWWVGVRVFLTVSGAHRWSESELCSVGIQTEMVKGSETRRAYSSLCL
jgi:hypothetical protein